MSKINKELLEEQLKLGKKRGEIAKELGIPVHRIYKAVNKYNLCAKQSYNREKFSITKKFLEEQRDLGKTQAQISKEFGILLRNIYKKSKKYNIIFKNSPKTRTAITKEFLEQEKAKGKSRKQIAKENHSNYDTIKKYTEKFDVYFESAKGSNKNDLTNKQFGYLTVVKQIKKADHSKNTKSAVWECICKCGNMTSVIGYKLTSSHTTSCGCYGKRPNKTGYEDIRGQFWKTVLSGAKKRNILMKVDIEYIWDLFLKQDKKCNFSGQDISFLRTKQRNADQTASIDRIDPSKGYIIGNIQVIHKDLNRMKTNISNERFIECCKMAYLFNKSTVERMPDQYFPKLSRFKGYKAINHTYWGRVIAKAKKRGLEFSITIEDVWELWLRQGGRCNITGVEIQFFQKCANKEYKNQTASIDRIDSNCGYTLDNIQLVHKDINAMKWNYPNDYFIETLKFVGRHQLDLDISHAACSG